MNKPRELTYGFSYALLGNRYIIPFFYVDFGPSQGIKRKRREFARLCCKSASNASESVVTGDCELWCTFSSI